jgi:selenide,water dikinase
VADLTHRERIRLTAQVAAAGCAAKLGPADLAGILARLPRVSHPDLLVGIETSDDAGVFRLAPDLALVSTVDFFTPIVDDPTTFGSIAAANALSDVYAMGGRPLTVLNIACFPQSGLPMEILGEILAGGAAKAAEAGALVVGGHTVADDEIKYGMAVTGVVHPDRITRNAGARPGDRLVLTKALGTGIVTTAAKHDRAPADVLAAAIDSMTTLNAAAADVAAQFEVHACTDVTGFSLLGHGYEMASASTVTLRLEASALPLLPGARDLAALGEITGGCKRNRRYLADKVRLAATVPADLIEVAFDPQTSGGLLIAVPEAQAVALRDALRARGIAGAAIVGTAVPRTGAAAVELG